MSDAFEGLGEYLGVFSDAGAVPTSLQGYGFGTERHNAALRGLGAQPASDSGNPEGPKPSASKLKIGTQRWQELRAMKIKDVRWGLNQLGYKAGSGTTMDSALKNAWANYVKLFTRLSKPGQAYPPDFVPAEGGFDSVHWVWANTYALADLGTRAKQAAAKGGNTPAASPAAKTPSPAPAPKSSGNAFVTSVASVQDILVRLGWKAKGKTTGPLSKDLTDGLYGSATVENWKQSANKRKLDPTITRETGTTVKVNESTFLSLKAVADQMVPPQAGQPQLPAPSGTTTITEARLNEVLGRLAGAAPGTVATWDRLMSDYQTRAKAGGYDTSIQRVAVQCVAAPCPPDRIVVNTKTWDAFVSAFNSLPAPTPAPLPPAQKSEVDQAMSEIAKKATATLKVPTLRKFLNIAIAQGKLKREPFKSDTWVSDYATVLVQMTQAAGPWKTAWEKMLVVGKLVASDKKSLKFYPDLVASMQKTVSDAEAQKKAATTTKPGFTKVTVSTVIDTVNKLNVTSKTFNTAGDAKELADALRTFLDNTKQSVPGDIVWVQDKTKDVFVSDEVLKKLVAAKQAEAAKAQATQTYRDQMVDEALKASTASVSIDDLQLAFIETVASKKAGENEKLFSKVKNTGSFDSATKDAYTALARTLIIGPAVQEFQKRLQAQLGPNFRKDVVEQTRNKIWAEYLSKAASKTDVKTLPSIAQQVKAVAAARKSRLGQQKVDAQKKDAAKKIVAEALAKSTFYVSVFDVQMGLLEAQARKQLSAPGVKVTGRTDDATLKALKQYIFADMVFPPNVVIGQAEFNTYLNNIGINVSGNKATLGWSNANWLALTQSAANFLSERAGAYMAKHGKPAAYSGLARIPVTDARFQKGTVVEAKAPPAKKPVTKTDKQKKLEAEAAKLKKQIAADQAAAKKAQQQAAAKKKAADEAAKKAAADASSAAAREAAMKAQADAAAAKAEVERLSQQLQQAQQQAQENKQQQFVLNQQSDVTFTTEETQQSGTPEFTPAPPAPTPAPMPAPEPEPAPTPEPAPVVEAGMMSPSALLLMSAVGLGLLFYGGDKQDKNQQTRYPSNRRGGRR